MSASDVPSPLTELFSPAGAPTAKLPAGQPTEVPEPLTETRGRRGARAPRAAKTPRERKAPRAPKAPHTEELALGAYPVARLLPPEVLAQDRVRVTQSRVIYLLIAMVVLVALAFGASYLYSMSARAESDAVQAQTSSVAAQQTRYAPVRAVQSQVRLAQSAQRVGAAGEIDWSSYFGKVQGVLPGGVSITAISGETASPTTSVAQDAAPLSAARAATVTLTINGPDEATIADALDAFQKLPGFASAIPGAITQGSSDQPGGAAAAGGSWSTTVTLSLTAGAFDNRFAKAAQ